MPPERPQHLFVAGPQRAGTTLLRLVLSAHPEVTITPETRSFSQLLSQGWPPGEPLTRARRSEAMAILGADEKLRSWPGFDVAATLAVLARRSELRLSDLLDGLLHAYAAVCRGGTRYLGNKKGCFANRKLALQAKAHFPDARFVYIVRDPRDVTRSMLTHLRSRTVAQAAAVCEQRGRHMQQLAELLEGDVLAVSYEELVCWPERVCRRICHFLGLTFSLRMLAFHAPNAAGGRLLPRSRHLHPHTTGPFNSALAYRWRKDASFTAAQLDEIERITAGYMSWYGYRPTAASWAG